MKLSQFRFELPAELVALEPPHRVFDNPDGTVEKVYRRDECRMMIVHRKSQTIEMFEKDENGNDTQEFITFRKVIDFFEEGDCLVLNDTKVFPARLFGTKEKTDAQIEVFLLRELNPDLRLWDVLVEPARKIRIATNSFSKKTVPWWLRLLTIPPLVTVRFDSCTTVRTWSLNANCLPLARHLCPGISLKSGKPYRKILRISRLSMLRMKVPLRCQPPVCILAVN